MVLAICTFLAVNIFGTKTYWKDIFWPDVPWWLKVPVPMVPFIEFFGIFTEPFALMIRLFGGARILSGVTIGDGNVIGINAVVTHDVPAYSVVGGLSLIHISSNREIQQ